MFHNKTLPCHKIAIADFQSVSDQAYYFDVFVTSNKRVKNARGTE